MSCVTCHMSHVTCQVSPVTCHLSCVTCHISHGQSGEASRWSVCYQRGLPPIVSLLNPQLLSGFSGRFIFYYLAVNQEHCWKWELVAFRQETSNPESNTGQTQSNQLQSCQAESNQLQRCKTVIIQLQSCQTETNHL